MESRKSSIPDSSKTNSMFMVETPDSANSADVTNVADNLKNLTLGELARLGRVKKAADEKRDVFYVGNKPCLNSLNGNPESCNSFFKLVTGINDPAVKQDNTSVSEMKDESIKNVPPYSGKSTPLDLKNLNQAGLANMKFSFISSAQDGDRVHKRAELGKNARASNEGNQQGLSGNPSMPIVPELVKITVPKNVKTHGDMTIMDIVIPDLPKSRYTSIAQNESNWREFSELNSATRFQDIYGGVTTFCEILDNERLLKNLASMDIILPSKAQQLIIPLLRRKSEYSLIAQAHNGSGKTIAFLIGLINDIDTKKRGPQAMILVPTYELVWQTQAVLYDLVKNIVDINVYSAVPNKENLPLETCHVIIGTVGTVKMMAKNGVINPSQFSYFIVDEADFMLDNRSKAFIVVFAESLPKTCHRVFISATFNEPTFQVARRISPNPTCIRLKMEDLVLPNVRQFYTYFDDNHEELRYCLIKNLFHVIFMGTVLAFTNTREDAEKVVQDFARFNFDAVLISGDLSPELRKELISQARSGKTKIIVTTNLMARGIDIKSINLILQFGLPTRKNRTVDCESYIHRVGRASRFGGKGISIVVANDLKSLQMIADLQELYSVKIEKLQPFSDEGLGTLEKIY